MRASVRAVERTNESDKWVCVDRYYLSRLGASCCFAFILRQLLFVVVVVVVVVIVVVVVVISKGYKCVYRYIHTHTHMYIYIFDFKLAIRIFIKKN